MYKPSPVMESLTVPVTTAILIAMVTAVYYVLRFRATRNPSWPKTKQHTAYTVKVTPVTKEMQLIGNSLDDFMPMGERELVHDVSSFFASRGNEFSVYNMDWEQESVVLVRPVDGVDLKKHPFFHEAQRKHAAEVLVLPLDQLQSVVDVISDKVAHVKQVFIYMSGRCGSTLLTRAVEASSVAQAVNEVQVSVDISTKVSRLRRSIQSTNAPQHHTERVPTVLQNDESAVMLMRNVFTLLNYFLVTSDQQQRSVIFYKLFPDEFFISDLMRRAFPTAKTVFLYRNGLDVTESWMRIWFRYNIVHRAAIQAMRLKLFWLFPKLPHYVTTFGDDPKFSTVRLHRSYMYYALTLWMCPTLHAAELQTKHPEYFFHAVIYYTALVRQKEEMIRLLMEKLEIDWKGENQEEDMKRISAVFVEDSQAGTFFSLRTSSPGEKWTPTSSSKWLGDWEREFMSDVCKQTGNEISGPDFLLPGTMT